jgi:hypothetical protein
MTDNEPSIDQMVLAYRRIRATMDEKEAQHKEEMEKLREDLELVSAKLLEICKEQNVDSIKTPNGTLSRRVKSRYWTTDWESMYKVIAEHNAPFLLEQRIHNTNMQQFLDENPEAYPPGLQQDRKYVIHVRKPTNR